MNKIKDNILNVLIWGAALLTMGVLLWIIIYIFWQGIPAMKLSFFEGLLPMIVSTLYVIGLSLLIATPIGIFSAIYLSEYAKPGKTVRLIRFGVESLSGIPSIIYGLFGFIFFVTAFRLDFSILAGSLTLTIMVLPTIIRTTEESLKSVPMSYREGSYGLGATKLRTVFRLIVPSALPGIVTAIILSIGRIVGETAAVYLTAGMVPRMPLSPADSGRTLAVHLYLLAKEAISFEEAFATAAVLIVLVFVINFIAKKIVKTR